MSPKQKMVSQMRSAATEKSGTSHCGSSSGGFFELISPLIKCFCAACLKLHCRSIKCTRCKKTVTMTGLTRFDAICLFGYINGQAFTIARNRSWEIYLCIDLGETTEYAPIRNTIHRGHNLAKWTRAN